MPPARIQTYPVLQSGCFGLSFANPVGIAAGFDKNAEVPDAMLALGFGFVEVGTVTRRPQEGNPRPRLFRLSEDQAVINRLGFNNQGHAAVLQRLRRRKFKSGIVGVNVGANKDSTDRISDYVAGINARIEGNEIVQNHYYDIGVAISTEKGLMVPVLRGVDGLSFAGVEKAIADYAKKGRAGKIGFADLEGGVFTITNGGTFGSLLSTPIVNAPQSGILGMHSIQDRPMAVNGKVEIRPMMYIALTYDHRVVDGKEAVTFLVRVKEYIENPGMGLLDL